MYINLKDIILVFSLFHLLEINITAKNNCKFYCHSIVIHIRSYYYNRHNVTILLLNFNYKFNVKPKKVHN
jgi:hypothetical protein